MLELNKENVIIIIIVVIIAWIIMRFLSKKEGFDGCISKTAVYPVGYPQFGLRGDQLRTSSIDNLYISPNRQIRLSLTGADMYDSDYPPTEQGVPDCRKVKCPENGYDDLDTCWQCGNPNPTKMKIPDLWPHFNTI